MSLDGYIADKNDGLDYLDIVPNDEGTDMGYFEFMDRIDALLMGRRTFEVLSGFDVEWPYKQPVFVWTNSLTEFEEKFRAKAFIISGTPWSS